MARPQKQGLDYFALDVSMDDEVELIEAEHGIEGFAVLIKMFQKIYSEGYFYKWNEKNQLLFSSRVSVNKEKVVKIIDDCLKWGIFNSELYEKYNILTSRRIQDHYIAAVYKRVNVEIIKEYLLVDVSTKDNITVVSVLGGSNSNASAEPDNKETDNKNEDTNIETDNIKEDTNGVSDIRNTQSKVKESKVYESKVYESNKYNMFFQTYNDQNIITHRELSPKIKEAIDKALKKDSTDNILKAIQRYGMAFRDEGYRFCKYKMTLDKFLTQNNGYTDWLDEGQKWINYSDFKNNVKDENNSQSYKNQNSKIKTKFHLAKSRGDKYTAEELEALVLNNQKKRLEKKSNYVS